MEWEQSDRDLIKDSVKNSKKVHNYSRHLKKGGRYNSKKVDYNNNQNEDTSPSTLVNNTSNYSSWRFRQNFYFLVSFYHN